jgi:N-acetylglucosamine repressor
MSPEARKRNALLQAIQRNRDANRTQLALGLAISNSRTCALVDSLVRDGLVVEPASTGDRRGRRGVGLQLNAEHGQLIGVDMEARRLRIVITDFCGDMIIQATRSLDPRTSGDQLLNEILDFIETTISGARAKCSNILGIGLAASGVIDVPSGTILHYDMMPQAVNLPLREQVARHFRLPCVVENNIRAMTLAEWTNGAARGLTSFVCMAVRSGVGAGIVLDGHLRRGNHGMGGEVGYMVLPSELAVAQWRNLQQTVSEVALRVDAESQAPTISDETARWAGEIIGSQLASIACIVDPQAFVLAGGLLTPGTPLWQSTITTFQEKSLPELAQCIKLLPAQLGPFSAAIGAANLCLFELFPTSP